MREHKQAQKEFYDTQEQEEKEADANRPAMFRKQQQQEPKSSDNQFDDPEARKMSKKAEDTKAWQNLQK